MTSEEWNENYKKGQSVILTKDDGSMIQTETRSEAWDMCGTSVVMVKGISGGYDLDRISAR